MAEEWKVPTVNETRGVTETIECPSCLLKVAPALMLDLSGFPQQARVARGLPEMICSTCVDTRLRSGKMTFVAWGQLVKAPVQAMARLRERDA